MKLVSFSPWQHTATSIPSSKHGDDIIQNFIISPPSTSNSFTPPLPPSKLIKSSTQSRLSSSLPQSAEMQPVISITSNHHISVLGHPSQSRKILRLSNRSSLTGDGSSANIYDTEDLTLQELPQWIYSSRPGSTTAFVPGKNEHGNKSPPVGAVIDPISRTIFVLQKHNALMKIWGLDDDVNGPDDDHHDDDVSQSRNPHMSNSTSSSSRIHSVHFNSPVQCMNFIPIKHQMRVKIKGNGVGSEKRKNDHCVYGGVAGLLKNGQMFVVMVCIYENERRIKVGIYGNDTSKEGYNGGHINGMAAKLYDQYKFLHSVVGFTPCGTKKGSSNIVHLGMKRKWDTSELAQEDIEEFGGITVTAVLRNTKASDCISFCRHTVFISSLNERLDQHLSADDDDSLSLSHQKIEGDYSKEIGDVKLPHSILERQTNGNGSSVWHKDVLVTQLDASHVSIVYQNSARNWYTTILDTRYGECIIKPFPLRRLGMSTNTDNCPAVVDIGGLNFSILGVLTSDNILTVYDVRRSVKLHEMDVSKVLRTNQENGAKCTFGIATHWFTGTIGITCNAITKSGEGINSTLSMSYARVGVYDTVEKLIGTGAGKKPFVKGSYNLARIIASSSAAGANNGNNLKSLNYFQNVQANEFNLTSWFPSAKRKSTDQATNEKDIYDVVVELEQYLQYQKVTNGRKRKSFYEKFEEIVIKLKQGHSNGSQKQGKKLQKKKNIVEPNPDSNSLVNCTSLPQHFINASFAIAIKVILMPDDNQRDKLSAANVLFRCIETGMVSGRNNFDLATSSITESNADILRKVLFVLKAQNSFDGTYCLPLQLISSLLQYCQDGITEEMLVSMIHFVICHATDNHFAQHWDSMHINGWCIDPRVKVLEKRLKKAMKEYESAKSGHDERCEDLQNLVSSLEKRLYISRQLFLIDKIVSHCNCNPALLRTSLRNGLTQAAEGEAEVLMLSLGKLLRRDENDKKKSSTRSINRLACISLWLSAVVDAHLGLLLSGDHTKIINRLNKEVSTSIIQTKAIMSLKELFGQFDKIIAAEIKTEGAIMEVTSVPLYGIESLIF